MQNTKYFIYVEDNKLNGCGQSKWINENIINVEVSEELFNIYNKDSLRYIWNGTKIIENPNYENDKKAQIRNEKDQLTLTPSDVERALLAAKGMDFEDLKTYLKEEHGYTDLQIKAIGVELRANDFFRGATMGEAPNKIRIVDAIGALLGYTPEDMDYLFENKKLPTKD